MQKKKGVGGKPLQLLDPSAHRDFSTFPLIHVIRICWYQDLFKLYKEEEARLGKVVLLLNVNNAHDKGEEQKSIYFPIPASLSPSLHT